MTLPSRPYARVRVRAKVSGELVRSSASEFEDEARRIAGLKWPGDRAA
jgi:hypothetical protein